MAAFDFDLCFFVLFFDFLGLLPPSSLDILESLDGSLGSSPEFVLLLFPKADDDVDDEDEEDEELSSPPEGLFAFNDLVISFRISSLIDILKVCNNNLIFDYLDYCSYLIGVLEDMMVGILHCWSLVVFD